VKNPALIAMIVMIALCLITIRAVLGEWEWRVSKQESILAPPPSLKQEAVKAVEAPSDLPIRLRSPAERIRIVLTCNDGCGPCPAYKQKIKALAKEKNYKTAEVKDWEELYKTDAIIGFAQHSVEQWEGTYPRVTFYVDQIERCQHPGKECNRPKKQTPEEKREFDKVLSPDEVHDHYWSLYRKLETEQLEASADDPSDDKLREMAAHEPRAGRGVSFYYDELRRRSDAEWARKQLEARAK
jgi:hypothetical protein